MKKLRIAITGGIGSGKSAVSSKIRGRGFGVIDADASAKEIMKTHPTVRSGVIAAFGSEAYSGSVLNAPYLAQVVFSNPENVAKINAIVHPVVIEYIQQQMELSLCQKDFAFTEAALIFEANMQPLFDLIVVVDAPLELRISRLLLRSFTTHEEILRRIDAQLPDEWKKSKADFVIDNGGTFERLEQQIDSLFSFLHQKSVAERESSVILE